MQFNGANMAEHIDVSANGPRVRLTRDIASVTMDFDGIEALNVAALGGADTIAVHDLSGTALNDAAIDLSATGGGDGQADTVILEGTDKPDNVKVTTSGSQVLTKGLPVQTAIAGSEAANDTLQVDTLGGKDRVTVGSDVTGLIKPSVDLGAGQ
jgi:hypothetical protein